MIQDEYTGLIYEPTNIKTTNMTSANKYLGKNGYDEVKRHEMITAPKIRIQALMQEYGEEQLFFHLLEYTKKLNNGNFNHIFTNELKVNTYLSNL